MARFLRLLVQCQIALGLALLAGACGGSDEGALEVAIVGDPGDPFQSGVLLSAAGQHVRAATTEGLVSLDLQGQVIPALADRWIVTDDGTSYIFRLRDGNWANGDELTGESARDALKRAVRRLQGTSIGYDVAQIADIRAMAGRVVEIRLNGPMPDFLQLLAQPELGLTHDGRGTGPMKLTRADGAALLAMISPEDRGLPLAADWKEHVREVRVRGLPAKEAIGLFDKGKADVVLGGRIETLPMIDTGLLSRGTARIDSAIGLFGLAVRRADGFLADPEGREALSMALDRDALLARFAIGGWVSTTRIVAPGLPGDPGTIGERWSALTPAQRHAAATARVAAWARANDGKAPTLTIALPDGPGADLLFDELARQTRAIGIMLTRSKEADADLVLVDRVARYANARWFLNQFHCGLNRGPCSADADAAAAEAAADADPAMRAMLFTEAETDLTALNAYIPIAQPVRWSLVRAGTAGFAGNQWAFHPLPPLAALPK
ncbi:MAG: ABC transporter substrate-binding protein [Candidatus Andeanibacterium colombiense]|uniref:ABC transporter substrate-binding protein n=1 Tax=Candidatus Andeanibacterium colombiense TaxID=3121345 RepID=A0AAJ6BLQ0_9SPHN|nr:MAG: ABC transporter substrate-binding protein [Sphingomonadaceae bacterium]